MKEERIDLDPLTDWEQEIRAERVIRRVMRSTVAQPGPRTDLLAAILLLGRPALAVASTVALVALVATARPGERPDTLITVGAALGVPPSVERVIRGEHAVDAGEMLAILGEMR